ncbi:MAG: hypothetical protein DI616_05145 [Paracoccus denitrificans]|uniref:CsbD family protein n=1 Tax=Paracoccus denitrificans TaxID=266 RepID=A0A533IAC4_PARDE|nr:MAG: hypothetical protein DI616_05145 [Paracoccus denitrificans]
MEWDRVAKNWLKLREDIQDKWSELSDEEIDIVAGNRERLAGKLQEKYGWTREHAEGEVDRFLRMGGTHGPGGGPDD